MPLNYIQGRAYKSGGGVKGGVKGLVTNYMRPQRRSTPQIGQQFFQWSRAGTGQQNPQQFADYA